MPEIAGTKMILINFVIVLGILIFVHELGHFIVAKLTGVKVEKFSLGFGPKLIGRTFGETEYLISVFPLGGYVKMFGEGGIVEGATDQYDGTNSTEVAHDVESDESGEKPLVISEEDKARSFANKSPLQRIAIVIAGPLFNIFFAWLVLIVLFMISYPVLTTRVKPLKDQPAARAGLLKNDLIVAINGKEVIEWEEIAPIIAMSKGALDIRVERNGAYKTLQIIPDMGTIHNLFGEPNRQPIIGVVPVGEVKNISFPPIKAVVIGTKKTWYFIDITISSMVKLVQGIVPLKSIGGPIQIADLANQAAKQGSSNFFLLLALISINLGILNLLPIPILDGGHLMFNSIELITKRPVSQKVREYAQQIGIVLLLGLMILAFYNDIARFFVGQG
jgi:regulator of sigma E protease